MVYSSQEVCCKFRLTFFAASIIIIYVVIRYLSSAFVFSSLSVVLSFFGSYGAYVVVFIFIYDHLAIAIFHIVTL